MQLNSLIVETRVRTAWSAIDLGFAVGKLFWLRGVLLYLCVAAPVFLLTRFVTDIGSVLPYLILWWCKPLFERPILFFLSRELFSEPMGFTRTLRNFRLWLMPGLAWILTVRRLSVTRAMYAPITLLERPNSSQYSQRASVLGGKYASEATWLTVVMYHVESFFYLALLVLLVIFFPDQFKVSFAWFNELSGNNTYVDIVYLIIMAVIAPFYTAAGFMLYISRRIELEGWDIEICFRDWMVDYRANMAQGQGVVSKQTQREGANV